MARVYLGLGTNRGEREQNMATALARLQERLRLVAVSSLYETAPWGVTDQPPFLNAAVAAETDLPPAELLAFVKGMEREMGRQPGGRWGPRLMDIDILLYDDLVLETPDLVIPHPRLTERAFVLVPLAEIAPDAVHPVYKQTIQALLARASDREGVRLWPPGKSASWREFHTASAVCAGHRNCHPERSEGSHSLRRDSSLPLR